MRADHGFDRVCLLYVKMRICNPRAALQSSRCTPQPHRLTSARLFEPLDRVVHADGELCDRCFFCKLAGTGPDTRRNPLREGDLLSHVMSRWRMYLAHLCKAVRWKLLRRPDKGRPQSAMNEGNLAVDETAHENIAALPDSPRDRKDLVTFRMRPPTDTNRAPGDGVSERWDPTSR